MSRRLIFTLLYDRGQFMLSRNFRLQAVGTIDWLFNNYDFATVSHGLDELMVLDVTRGARDPDGFTRTVKHIAGLCFIPMTVGGGVTSFEVGQRYLRSGADKLLINSSFSNDPALCRSLAKRFGRQCIVAGIDYKRTPAGARRIMTHNGMHEIQDDLSDWVDFLQQSGAGELLFQSMDQDGTGMGLDLPVIDELRQRPEVPCILMGGVGKADHIIGGLSHPAVDAVATANLFNFMGAAFLEARKAMTAAGIEIPQWDGGGYSLLKSKFSGS